MMFISAHQFKSLHVERSPLGNPMRVKKPVPNAAVRKQSSETVVKLDDRTLRFTISTSAVDRDMDTINVKGWELANFERNPVVLWAHRADELPIGKCVDCVGDDLRLSATVQFLPGGYGAASELADCVYRMAADGYLAATSVGFRPLEWDFSDDPARDDGGWFPGIDFQRQELVELSIVSVPSNPDALIDGAIPIEPGGGDNDSAPAIVPAPVQLLNWRDNERLRRRVRAASLGVF